GIDRPHHDADAMSFTGVDHAKWRQLVVDRGPVGTAVPQAADREQLTAPDAYPANAGHLIEGAAKRKRRPGGGERPLNRGYRDILKSSGNEVAPAQNARGQPDDIFL